MRGCCVEPHGEGKRGTRFNRFSLCRLAGLVLSVGKTETSNEASPSHQIFHWVPRIMEPSMPTLLCPWWILDYGIYGYSKVFHTMGSELAGVATELGPWAWIRLSICQSRVVLTGFLHNYKVSEIWSHHIRDQMSLDQTDAVAIAANMSFYHDHKAVLESIVPRHLCKTTWPSSQSVMEVQEWRY